MEHVLLSIAPSVDVSQLFSFDGLFTWENLAGFVVLLILELVLGIDNLLFMMLKSGALPDEAARRRAMTIGLTLGLTIRVALLAGLVWVLRLLEADLATVFGFTIKWRDVIFLGGGIFLIYTAVKEMAAKTEPHDSPTGQTAKPSFARVIAEIAWINLIFSADSVLTAVGMSNSFWIMATAVLGALFITWLAERPIREFVERHLSIQVLALAFVLVIGVVLFLEGLHVEIPKPYIYVALGFALSVNFLQLWIADRTTKRITPAV